MKVDHRTRLNYRLQSGLFIVLFLALLGVMAWLSQQFSVQFDLSSNQRNSLSNETSRLLQNVDEKLDITLFVSPVNSGKTPLETLFQRYQRLQPKIEFRSLNPDFHPELLRDYDVRYDGEAVLEYQGRQEKVSQVNEVNVSNAIQRLLRQGERWLVFLEGHGERNPYREANHDYSLLATQLATQGYNIEILNLTQTDSIPDNTNVLILASPRVPLLPGEVDRLQAFLQSGGNLLWLADPEQTTDGLEQILDELAIGFLPGIVVDPNSQLMGLDRVDFALVGEYPRHSVTNNLDSLSIFPEAQAIEFYGEDDWLREDFLHSNQRSWSETGELRGEIFQGDNADEASGPLTLGLTLSRSQHNLDNALVDQRIAVIGDADFLANRYLGNGSNLDIGVNLINWLSHDDRLISISPRPAPDTRLELNQFEQLSIAILFLLAMPGVLLASGIFIWLKRRKY
ncbi:MAG: GldG family protein [Pseudomonadota bacterium]